MSIVRPQAEMLENLIDVANLRQRVIAQNVSNVNTPGYRDLSVTFEDAFGRLIAQGNLKAAKQLKPKVVEGLGGASRADGNNVDIDQQMGLLTKNSLLFRTYAQLLATELNTMRTAISGRQT